MKKMPEEESGI